MFTRIRTARILAFLATASLLVACGGGGGTSRGETDMPSPLIPTLPTELPPPEELADRERQEAAVQHAVDAWIAAERAALGAEATCADSNAACTAAGEARDAASRAAAALADVQAATTADDAERAARAAEVAAGDATIAADTAARLAAEQDHTGLFAATLTGYEEVTVRLDGSDQIHRVTCGQPTPCEVSDLRIDAQGLAVWYGTERVHVSSDETGFFLIGERTVTYPDGQMARFSCPNGCGINTIFLDADGDPTFYFDPKWAEPEFEVLDGDGDETGDEDGSGMDDEDGDGTGSIPSVPTPPVYTTSYTDLPAELTELKIDHWELSDEAWFTLNVGTRQWERLPLPEVVCPGINPDGNKCKVRDTDWNVDRVLKKMEDFIAAQPGRDKYGYATFGPDLNRLQAIQDKLLMLQQLTSEDEEFLSYATYGLWGEYSAFGQLSLRHPVDPMSDDPVVSLHWFAFGDLYGREDGGKPKANQGSSTWRGPMVGVWTFSNTPNGGGMDGTSELVYDFAEDTLDLTLTIENALPINSAEVKEVLDTFPEGYLAQAGLTQLGAEIPYGGDTAIRWRNVRQNGDGSFFISGNHEEGTAPHHEYGILDGDFYGPNAEEVAGYFERTMGLYDLKGVFGGKRQMENQQ